MEPTPESEQSNRSALPPQVASRSHSFAGMLSRTSEAFTAEYVVFLIALGIVLSNLAWLVYVFFGLIVDTMHGGAVSSYISANLFVLWLAVSSVITIPIASMLWSRVQGELAANDEYKGTLPLGAARGFRTFWIVLSVLGMIGMLMAAVYAPAAALVSGTFAAEVLLAVTLPSLINIAILATGIYLVTRRIDERRKARLIVWAVVCLTVILFATDFIWASNVKPLETPSRTYPSIYEDPYQNIYDDTYYDYSDPSY